MSKKYTKVEIEEKLIVIHQGKIFMTGEYIDISTRTTWKCLQGHEWTTKPYKILGGTGCARCAGKAKITKEMFNEKLAIDNRGIQLIGEFTGRAIKTTFICSNKHIWIACPKGILVGKGCPECAKINSGLRQRRTKKDINEQLEKDNRDIKLVGKYITNKTKTTWKCAKGHEWQARADAVLNGTGCSVCNRRGFDPNKPGYRYVLLFENNIERPFIKYGITNNIEQRLATHRSKIGNFKMIWTYYDINGHDTQKWESKIKKKYGGKYVTNNEAPKGWTETLSPDLIDSIIYNT